MPPTGWWATPEGVRDEPACERIIAALLGFNRWKEVAMSPAAVVRSRLIAHKAWLVWAVGSGVYVLAVFHRSSLGVAGPMAEQRLGLTAAQLASFVMLQLAIYAAMQIPTGVLVDRFGPRRMLLAATLVMGSAQILFSLVHGYLPALLARGLLGCGDAMTYISVLRLVAGWFPARRYSAVTGFTGLMGSVGNLAATLPLTGVLHGLGWTTTFAVAGGLSLAYGLLLLRPTSPAPFRIAEEAVTSRQSALSGRRVIGEVRTAWRLPAGRLGFWVHFTTMGGPTVFGVLWGYPYLTQGLGYAPATASALLMLLVIGGVVANLIVSQVVGRKPEVRTPIAFTVSLVCVAGWTVLIALPHPPLPVVVLAILAFSVGGPASAVAFMLARDYNPRHRISTATGMVNVGGFCAAVIGLFGVGQLLDLVEPGSATHTAGSFRVAFLALLALTSFGSFRLFVWWRRARAEVLLAEARGEDVPVRLHLRRWELVDECDLARQAGQASEKTDEKLG